MTTTPVSSPEHTAPAPDGLPAIRLDQVTKDFGAVHAVRGIDLHHQAGRDRRVPRPQRRRQDLDHRHGARAVTADQRHRAGARARAPPGGRPWAGLRGDADRWAAQGPHGRRDGRLHRQPLRRHLDRAARSRRSCDVPASTASPTARSASCSGGEQQRLRFAMALLSDPALLLLDEPTTGMDVEGRRAFWAAIREDAERGRTVLFATHYLEEADAYADRIVLVQQGPRRGGRLRRRGQGPRRRPDRARHPARSDEHLGLDRIPGVDGVEVRGDTVLVHARDTDAVARHLLTQHRRPRPRDHHPRPRGRLPGPHRRDTGDDPDEHHRRRPGPGMGRPAYSPDGRVQPDPAADRAATAAAQPAHRDLHPGDARGVLPGLRRATPAQQLRRRRRRSAPTS